MIEAVTYLEHLREIAIDQHGFVTSAQAGKAGIARPELAKMVARGRIERMAHGVYRVSQVPASQYDNYMLAVLWTGAPEACLSHESALAIREISDVNPTRIHVAIAKARRIKRSGGAGIVLHHVDIVPSHITWFEQIPIVRIALAIEQCIETGSPSYIIRQAIEQAGKTSELTQSAQERLLGILELRNDRPQSNRQP